MPDGSSIVALAPFLILAICSKLLQAVYKGRLTNRLGPGYHNN